MINARPCPTKVSCTVLVPNVAPVDAEEPAGFFSSETPDPPPPPPPTPPPPPPPPCVGPGCRPPPNINGDGPTPYIPRPEDPPPQDPPPNINQDGIPPVFLNEEQTCGAECPDGSSSSHTVAAGLYRGATQAQANAIALSVCQKEAAAQALCFQTESLPDVCKDSSYNQTIVATGGTPHVNFAYDWEITGGSLPGGITLNPISGALTGIPNASGAFTFTVKITDAAGQTKSTSLAINVFEITSAGTLPSGIVSESYPGFTFTRTPATGLGTWTVSGGTFPPGLTVNASTGVVTGTPSTKGIYSFTIAFSFGSTGCSKPCTIRIWDADNTRYSTFNRPSPNGVTLVISNDVNPGNPFPIGMYVVRYYNTPADNPYGLGGGNPYGIAWAGVAPPPCDVNYNVWTTGRSLGSGVGAETPVHFLEVSQNFSGFTTCTAANNPVPCINATLAANPLIRFELSSPTNLTVKWDTKPTQICGCNEATLLGGSGFFGYLLRIGKP